MRIAELAELAGVTVRTLRYYHQIGVLPEPPRRSNRYREYSVDHLITVLRIGQLTDSGLSLEQAKALITESEEPADEVLDHVDRDLEHKIAVLQAQRDRLADARTGGHVGLSKVAAALSLSTADVPTAVLFAHLYKNHEKVDQFADALLEPELRSVLAKVQEQFDGIDDLSTPRELDQLAEAIDSMVPEVATELPELTREQSELLLSLFERNLNDKQREFLRSYAIDS